MTDRELLERAARAAGYLKYEFKEDLNEIWCKGHGIWCPLTDNADAFVLAVEAGLHVRFFGKIVACEDSVGEHLAHEPYGSDKHAATRRAITRAAAAIGEQK